MTAIGGMLTFATKDDSVFPKAVADNDTDRYIDHMAFDGKLLELMHHTQKISSD